MATNTRRTMVAVEGIVEEELGPLVATYNHVEFRVNGDDWGATKIAMLRTLKARKAQAQCILDTRSQPFRQHAQRMVMDACDVLGKAINAVKPGADTMQNKPGGKGRPDTPTPLMSAGKQAKVLCAEVPWDLSAYIGQYREDHFRKTPDVTLPKGWKNPTTRGKADPVVEDEFGEDGEGFGEGIDDDVLDTADETEE